MIHKQKGLPRPHTSRPAQGYLQKALRQFKKGISRLAPKEHTHPTHRGGHSGKR